MSIFCNNCIRENIDVSKFCSGCGNILEINIAEGPLKPKTILANRYRVITLVKAGGMGSIYKAVDEKLGNLCAIKELIPGDEAQNKQLTEWFRREARILAQLDHPNLPKVFDYFVSSGRYFLIMSFIEGEELEAILAIEGNPGLPEEKVIEWAKQILNVLDYLHSQNPPLVYRDIKPTNIMIHKDGRAILIDFGLARTHQYNHTTAIGTPGYAPLEQYQGKSEPRSDIYALGATMHHLLTGKYPVLFKFEPLRDIIPAISSELEHVVAKALKDNVSERFSSARDMLQALYFSKGVINEISEKQEEAIKYCSLNQEMISIPAGTFQMGSDIEFSGESPVHTVHISSFYISKYPLTNKDYCDFLNSEGNQLEGRTTWLFIMSAQWCGIVEEAHGKIFKVKIGYENRPVVNVTWFGAVAYCNWLSEKDGLVPCYGSKGDRGDDPAVWRTRNGYRLPTEAEWEYACRGGTTTAYYWGDEIDKAYCWYQGNSKGNHHSVGLKLPNNFGLYDMIGNVSEWCNDWYGPYSADTLTDPAGFGYGQVRVPRGGGCVSAPFYCRSSSRSCSWPSSRSNYLGFRLARTQSY